MPVTAPLAVLPPSTGGGAPAAPSVVLAAASGGGAPAAPLVVLGQTVAGSGGLMIITGPLTDGGAPVAFPPLAYHGEEPDGRDIYGDEPEDHHVFWDFISTCWTMAGIWEGRWESTANVDSPLLVPAGAWHAVSNPDGWKPVAPATGTPVVTLGDAVSAPLAVLPPATGGGAPTAPSPAIASAVDGGVPASPGAALAEAAGGGAPATPGGVLAQVAGGNAPAAPDGVMGRPLHGVYDTDGAALTDTDGAILTN